MLEPYFHTNDPAYRLLCRHSVLHNFDDSNCFITTNLMPEAFTIQCKTKRFLKYKASLLLISFKQMTFKRLLKLNIYCFNFHFHPFAGLSSGYGRIQMESCWGSMFIPRSQCSCPSFSNIEPVVHVLSKHSILYSVLNRACTTAAISRPHPQSIELFVIIRSVLLETICYFVVLVVVDMEVDPDTFSLNITPSSLNKM